MEYYSEIRERKFAAIGRALYILTLSEINQD